MYVRFNIIVKYLPLYSPDFNPIKQSFNNLKVWIRRNYHIIKDDFKDFEAFLNYAIIIISIEEKAAYDAKSHFRKAEIYFDNINIK